MRRILIFAVVALFVVASMSSAELAVGDAAPDFELAGSDGETHRLSELRGKTVVVAWFPKAFTGG